MTAVPPPQGLALRISITDRCQLRCRYCLPAHGIPLCDRDQLLTYEEITALVACLQDEFGLCKVRITGGEPLVRPDIERLIGMLAELDVPDLALTTNGARLAPMAAVLKQAGLERVNISLDSLSPDVFHWLTRGGDLRATLAGVYAALTHDLRPVKLNTVVIRGINDAELPQLVAFAIRNACEIRLIELMPIGPGADFYPDGFMSSAAVRRSLSAHFVLNPARPSYGSSARLYQVTDADGRRGTVGFISSCSDPFCGGCNRLRVTADGRLIGCLARNGGISVREMLRTGDRAALCEAVRAVLGAKRRGRLFAQGMAMASIGG